MSRLANLFIAEDLAESVGRSAEFIRKYTDYRQRYNIDVSVELSLSDMGLLGQFTQCRVDKDPTFE